MRGTLSGYRVRAYADELHHDEQGIAEVCEIMFDTGDRRVSRNAAWVLAHLSPEDKNIYLISRYDELADFAMSSVKHENRGLLFAILIDFPCCPEFRTDLFDLLEANDRYFQKPGSLLLLHRNIALNEENATAWYWAFNEFDKQAFSKEEFVEGLHYFLAVNEMSIKKAAVDKEFNCFKNTYLAEKKFDIKTVMDEDTYPFFGSLHLLRVNEDKKFEKAYLTKAEMPLHILIYAIAKDNPEESSHSGQVSIDKIMEEKRQVGKYFPMRYSKLIDMLLEAENKKLLTLNNNFGNRFIEFSDVQYDRLLNEYYME